ncbi:MAG: hypothetical protein AAF412_03520 [Pseudomonadota bacterium]
MSKFVFICQDRLNSLEYEVLHLPALQSRFNEWTIDAYGYCDEQPDQDLEILTEIETDLFSDLLQ